MIYSLFYFDTCSKRYKKEELIIKLKCKIKMERNIPKGFPSNTIASERAWNKRSNISGIVHPFSSETQEEVRYYIRSQAPEGLLTRIEIECVEYNPKKLPSLTDEIEEVRPQVDTGIGFVVFPKWVGLNVHQSRVASWLVDNAFGETRVQDEEGSRLIEIFNMSDNLSMKSGARYHVTREGNSPHTDAVQVLEDPDYLCLRCVSDALVGGENILVSADSIYNHLLENAPWMIRTLNKDFFFHSRGVSPADGKEHVAAPILSIDDGGLRLRFLDHYIREGHKVAGQSLTHEQERAIQYLNSLFEQSDLQFRARLEPGQQVVFANKRMLHARTEFTDYNSATGFYNPAQLDNLETANRLMDRTWSYKRN